jgi:hypothetical protein
MSTKKDRLKIILNRAIGLFLISLLLSFFWLVPVLANTGWIGTIQYTENYHKDYQYSTEDPYNINAYCLQNKTVNISVQVCFQEGKIIDARASAHYEADHQERCQWTQDHVICCGGVPIDAATYTDREKGCHKKTPGNRGDVSYGWNEVKMGQPEIEDVYLRVREDGHYTLGIEVSLPIHRSYNRSGSTQFACSGEIKKEPSPDPDIISIKHFSFSASGNVTEDDLIIEKNRILHQVDQASTVPHSCFISGCGRDAPVLKSDPDTKKEEYSGKTKASWQFKKACFGVITQSEGDVRIIPPKASGELSGEWIGPEGWPAQPGCVEASPGTTIKTGPRSRIKIIPQDGVEIRLGSNSEIELSNLCPEESESSSIKLDIGKLQGLVKKIGQRPFEIKATNSGGKRGKAPEMNQIRLAQALIERFSGIAWAAEQDLGDLSSADLTNFALAVQVERYPGLLNVKALKGDFFIHYSNVTKQIKQGQEFTQRWEEPVDPSDYIEFLITADQFPNKDGVPNSNPCKYLEYMHSKMQETLERCEAIAEEQSGIQQQCESLKQQIEQLEQTIKQQCPKLNSD